MTQRSRPRSSRLRGLALAWSLAIACSPLACLAQQKPAEKLIDPRLRADATALVAERGPGLGFDRYRAVDVELRDEAFDGSGPLSPDAHGRATLQQRMTLRMIGGEVEWRVECVVQRRVPLDGDFAAELDETRDEVAVACQIASGEPAASEGQRWRLELGGTLGGDLIGELRSVDEREAPVELTLELLLWYQLMKMVRRPLPTPLVQIRGSLGGRSGTQAAMIFARPERIWFDARLQARDGEVLLASLIALRLLPIGLET
ncbi:hypothetical protein ACNOYE_19115 [Nannocystaceae bacterium ST9]